MICICFHYFISIRGATCYLNSLLQAMYMTPELRAGLFSIDPNDLGVQFVSLYFIFHFIFHLD